MLHHPNIVGLPCPNDVWLDIENGEPVTGDAAMTHPTSVCQVTASQQDVQMFLAYEHKYSNVSP